MFFFVLFCYILYLMLCLCFLQWWDQSGGFHLCGECSSWPHPGCWTPEVRLSLMWKSEWERRSNPVRWLSIYLSVYYQPHRIFLESFIFVFIFENWISNGYILNFVSSTSLSAVPHHQRRADSFLGLYVWGVGGSWIRCSSLPPPLHSCVHTRSAPLAAGPDPAPSNVL